MHPYWIRSTDYPLGVGITAISDGDAITLYELAFGRCEIISLNVINDMRGIDQKHVAPNMGNWFQRGIWYPLGFESVSN